MKISLLLTLLQFSGLIFGQSYSNLKIDISPENANVYIDNAKIERANLLYSLTVTSGKHIIEASKPGYLIYQTTVNLLKGESRTINISLKREDRSSVTIYTTAPDVRLKINGTYVDLDRTAPTHLLLAPTSNDFNFTQDGMIPVSRNIKLDQSGKYDIKVDLRGSYPDINPAEVNRKILPRYDGSDILKPETRKAYNHSRQWTRGIIVGLLTGAISSALAVDGQETNAFLFMGILVGGTVGFATKPKEYNVPDYKNIEYNRSVVPSLLKEKNSKIDEYNNETQRIIRQRQKEIYEDSAIKVRKAANVF